MPEWLRVRDEHGNEFDLPPNHPLIKRKVVEVIKDYPENKGSTAVSRAAKVRVDKAGKPALYDKGGNLPPGATERTAGKSTGGTNTGRDVGQPEKE